VNELSMPQRAREFMESGKRKLCKDKDAEGALVDFHQAVTAAPGYYEAHYQIAMAYFTLGAREFAEASFRKSIELSGDNYGDAEIGLGSSPSGLGSATGIL
jgi:Tfp pilus assembly protein PilF